MHPPAPRPVLTLTLLAPLIACATPAEQPRVTADIPAPRTTGDVPTPRMAMSFNLGRDPRSWEAQHLDASSRGILVEMVPKGDSVGSWTEMVGQQIIFTPMPVGDFVTAFVSGLRNADPDVKVRGERGADSSITLEYASTVADEVSVRRFFQGPDGVYMMAYHARPSSPGTKPGYLMWKEIVAESRLLPNPKAGN